MDCIKKLLQNAQQELVDAKKYVVLAMHSNDKMKQLYINLAKDQVNHYNMLMQGAAHVVDIQSETILCWVKQKTIEQKAVIMQMINTIK